MRRRTTTAVLVLALAGLAPLAAAGAADRDGRSDSIRATLGDGELPELVPLSDRHRLGRTEARSGGRERAQEAVHPVEGDFDYGGSDAGFGVPRSGHVHEGQDVFAPPGTPLVAVREGEVVEAGTDGGRGNHLAIHNVEEDETYVYFHLLEPASVSAGERVRAGQRVGQVGCTGSCYGPHLHFEIHSGRGSNGAAEDPLPDLQRWDERTD